MWIVLSLCRGEAERNDFDKKVLSKISKYDVDIIVAAGYMLFSPIICNYYKILNIHPALPNGPIGTWKNVILDLINKESTYSGISIHLMTPELDEGPNISFCKFNIKDNNNINLWEKLKKQENKIEDSDIFWDIRKRIIFYERALLKKTLEKISNGEIGVTPNKPKNLSEEINQRI